MPVDLAAISNGRKWHIDHINNAPSADVALRRAEEFLRAELRDCQLRRSQDADGLRWQLAHMLAGRALEIHDHRPSDEFRGNPPKLPGGGWVPKPGASVRHP
jgi:hypothetical protein